MFTTHIDSTIIIIISIISYCFLFMHFRSTEHFNKVWCNILFCLQFILAWFFTAGLFQTAMVIMTHINQKICELLYISCWEGPFRWYNFILFILCIFLRPIYTLHHPIWHTSHALPGWDPIRSHGFKACVCMHTPYRAKPTTDFCLELLTIV